MEETPQDPDTEPTAPADFNAPGRGLTSAEAARRLAEHGENVIHEERSHPLRKFLAYFWGPIPWMIEVATVGARLHSHSLAASTMKRCNNNHPRLP